MNETQDSADGYGTQPGGAFARAARDFRRALRRHELSEPAGRILDVILFYSLERGEFKALIPRQGMFCRLCGLTKGKVSAELDRLERARVIECERVDTGRGRGWCRYGLLQPDGWRVPERVREDGELRDLEGWLEVIDADQPELIAPPESLNDLLRANFVETRAGPGTGTDGGLVRSAVVESSGSPAGNFVAVESRSPGPEVTCGVTGGNGNAGRERSSEVLREGKVACEVTKSLETGQKVTPGGTLSVSRARVDRSNRLVDSRSIQSRSGSIESIDEGLAKRLFAEVGERERQGRCADLWRWGLREAPEFVEELLGVLKDLRLTGRPVRNPAAWMNTSLRTRREFAR